MELICDECWLRFYAFRELLLHLLGFPIFTNPSISNYLSLEVPLCLLYSQFFILIISIIFAAFPFFNSCISHYLSLHFPLFVAAIPVSIAAFPFIYCCKPKFYPCNSPLIVAAFSHYYCFIPTFSFLHFP